MGKNSISKKERNLTPNTFAWFSTAFCFFEWLGVEVISRGSGSCKAVVLLKEKGSLDSSQRHWDVMEMELCCAVKRFGGDLCITSVLLSGTSNARSKKYLVRDPSLGKKGNPDRFIFLLSFPRETSGLCKAICCVFHCFILKVSAIRHSALLISHHCLRGRFFMIWGFAFMKFTLCFWVVLSFSSLFFPSFVKNCSSLTWGFALLSSGRWIVVISPAKKWEGADWWFGETLITDMALVKAQCQGNWALRFVAS